MTATAIANPPHLRLDLGPLTGIERLSARTVRVGALEIAVFRTADDAVFAIENRCPHKAGPLSQGIVHGRHVTCPLHNWVIGLEDGQAAAPDSGCVTRYAVEVQAGHIWLTVAPLS